jgi:hypothetical protein
LPLGSVAVSQEGGKVVVNEYPSPTGLACRQCAALGAAAHFLRMHLQEGRGFSERQRLHDRESCDELPPQRWSVSKA